MTEQELRELALEQLAKHASLGRNVEQESFLQDHAFLQEVNRYRVTRYSARIMVLDFETEQPIAVIEGRVTAGSISINANSATRRTGNLTIVFDNTQFDLSNPDNLVAINKKIRISIGINNPFFGRNNWRNSRGEFYPEILFFPQGLFLITGANSSTSATARTINLTFIDKGGMLNGVCGGTIPASITLHDKWVIDGDGNVTVFYPKIREIIQEVVHHFGRESPARIIINDLPHFGRRVVQYAGSTPIWFQGNPGDRINSNGWRISPSPPPEGGFNNVFFQGDDLGYMITDLIFPGEFTQNAGTTVSRILDEIVKILGNYEYFYDVDGYFIFQRIQHFEMTGQAPLLTSDNALPGAGLNTPFNISPDLDASFQDGFLPHFKDDQFINEFMDTDLVSTANYNPQYANIKNDFVVWGTRQKDGNDHICWMHLAIDEKPKWEDTQIIGGTTLGSLCNLWFWEVRDADNNIREYLDLADNRDPIDYGRWKWVEGVRIGENLHEPGVTIRLHSPSLRPGPAATSPVEMSVFRPHYNDHAGVRAALNLGIVGGAVEIPFEWREELYRRALKAFGTSSVGSDYDAELRAEWRNIFDPNSLEFFSRWNERFGSGIPWRGYRREIITDPHTIRYWLDIIDSNSALGAYSVNRIGRRSQVRDDSQIHEVLTREVPDIVFIDGSRPLAEQILMMQEQIMIGQNFNVIPEGYMPLFEFRASFGSCYEVIRDMLHRHLIYNASVTVASKPIFYLDVNRIIRLNFPQNGIVGNFIISRLTWNLGGNPRMNITANEAVTIV